MTTPRSTESASWQVGDNTDKHGGRRAAVIDIGSNSVRLVVYDSLRRAPWREFNEKILCGLGSELASTGRLSVKGSGKAVRAVRRFMALLASMDIGHLDVVATAAVREAEDGDQFVARLLAEAGANVRVLSGREEAFYAAQGVRCSIPDADGIVGDLGGGSLELVMMNKGAVGEGHTLPLGALRLAEESGGDLNAAAAIARHSLDALPWLAENKGRSFYAVGGAWRTLARVHMHSCDYPLHIIGQYTLSGDEAMAFCEQMMWAEQKGWFFRPTKKIRNNVIPNVAGVSRARRESLPVALLSFYELLRISQPAQVIFCAEGLREGLIFESLDEKTKAYDPLISACRDMAASFGRFGLEEQAMVGWTNALFEEETPEQERLRRAACLLGDIGWRAHPDYRDQQAFNWVLQAPFIGIDHAGRVSLAVSAFARYRGRGGTADMGDVPKILDEASVIRARAIGLALRLAHIISGSTPRLLSKCKLHRDGETLVLNLFGSIDIFDGDAVETRLGDLAKVLSLKPVIIRD